MLRGAHFRDERLPPLDNRLALGAQRHLLCALLPTEVLAEKAASCLATTVIAQHGIQEISVAVDGMVKVPPLASDLPSGLVEIPGRAAAGTTFLTQPAGKEGSEACLPPADGLARGSEAPKEKQLRDVTKTEFVAEAPEGSVEKDVLPGTGAR